MPWAITNTSGKLFLTPDGSTSENLRDLLEQSITLGLGLVTKLADDFYVVNEIEFRPPSPAEVNTTWRLFMSGITLRITGSARFRNGFRFRASVYNKAGAFDGQPVIELYASVPGQFGANVGLFSNSSGSLPVYKELDDLVLKHQHPTGDGISQSGTIMGGNGTTTQSSFRRCTFSSSNTGNSIIYADSGPVEDCRFINCPVVEFTSPDVYRGLFFSDCSIIKNFTTNLFLEQCRFVNVTKTTKLTLIGSRNYYLTDTTFPTNDIDRDTNGGTAFLRNSVTLSGNDANALVYLLNPAQTSEHKRLTNGSGLVAGGNTDGLSTALNSDRIVVNAFVFVNTNLSQVITDNRGTYKLGVNRYGKLPFYQTLLMQGTAETRQQVAYILPNDASVVEPSQAVAGAYTGLAISYALNNSTVTISESRTKQQLHDWLCAQKSSLDATSVASPGGVLLPRCYFPELEQKHYELSSGIFRNNLVITPTGALTGTQQLIASKSLTLQSNGDKSGRVTIAATGKLNVTDGTTILNQWQFEAGAIVDNLSANAAIVQVPSDQVANITVASPTAGGGSVTIQAPALTTRIFGIPNVAGSILMVQDLTSLAITYPTLVAGEATVEVQSGRSYRIRADAPGYTASRFITFPGATTREVELTLDAYRTLYEGGVDRSAQIIFDPVTYEITIADDMAQLSFADVFHTLENYLATPQGLLYSAHPYPVVLPDRNILWFPYDTTANQINPARVKPDPTNTIDPALLFEVYLEGATDPTFDLFDFSAANGRIIRVRSQIAIANVEVSGGLSAGDRSVIDAIATDTARLDALIENVSGDRFTAKALEASPAGSGGGSGATPEQIWAYATRSLTDKAGFAPSAADIAVAVWGAATRTLTSAVSSFSVADIWNHSSRSLTDKAGFAPSASDVAVAVWGATTRSLTTLGGLLSGVAQQTGVDTLLTRLTDARAAKLDRNLAERTDVQVTVDGGFSASDRTTLNSRASQSSVDTLPVPPLAVDIAAEVETRLADDFASIEVDNTAIAQAVEAELNPKLQLIEDQATIAARNTQL